MILAVTTYHQKDTTEFSISIYGSTQLSLILYAPVPRTAMNTSEIANTAARTTTTTPITTPVTKTSTRLATRRTTKRTTRMITKTTTRATTAMPVTITGQENELNTLSGPKDLLIDKETNSLIICDRVNRRVVRWSRLSGSTQGEILIDNIDCFGLAMDEQRYLYICNIQENEVRRYQLGEKNDTLVADGNDLGNGTSQRNRLT
ncbi:unnamed protein product [Rotaria magnacalcarata]|uniref:Uncharacterized protein n=2 Tax=Rotaria magnacalcarata TaxID=392030 RepID=A0A816N7Y1_9BILA|nr:unnamed protein product [Rotaria magnacalcarata]